MTLRESALRVYCQGMKNFFNLRSFLLLFLLCAPTLAQNWVPYNSPNKRFTASFPGRPMVAEAAGLCTVSFTKSDGAHYQVMISPANPGQTNIVQMRVDLARKKEPGHKVVRLGSFEGARSETSLINDIVIVANGFSYSVSVTNPKGAPPADAARFLDSFQLR